MGKNPVGVAIFNHFFLPLKPALQTLWATRIEARFLKIV
jgi:hypothetical protein